MSKDKVGYLTMHFQAAMECQIVRRHVLLVYSTSVGTSRLLKSRILRALPDQTIIDVVSAGSLPTVLAGDIGLMVSTINLSAVAMPVVYVTAFFNNADIKRVTETVITEKLCRATSLVIEN